MLTDTEQAAMLQAAQSAIPHEMCGLLFRGHGFLLCENVSANPKHAFEIEHAAYLRALARYGTAPWAIVHSHPTSWAWPSSADGNLMDALIETGHTLAMVIVGLRPNALGKGPQIAVYDVLDGAYTETWRIEL